MKAKTLLVLLAVGAVVLLVALLIRSTPKKRSGESEANAAAQASNPGPAPQLGSQSTAGTGTQAAVGASDRQRGNTVAEQENWAGKPLPPGSNLQERLDELARRRGVPLNVLTQQIVAQGPNITREAADQINRPVVFYGKAVDENGAAVSGANVAFGCIVFPTELLATNRVTDAQGVFAMAGITGAMLNVRVSKQGYEEAPESNQNHFAYYTPAGNGFHADPNNPVIFHLRRKQ